jgi:hypothetical protein
MPTDQFRVLVIPVLSARVIIIATALATMFILPSRAAEKLPAHPKLAYRQIDGGCTLALEAARRDKTFFLCLPDKTCISVRAVGWRKPFIVTRTGSVSVGYEVFDTSPKKPEHPVDRATLRKYLANMPLYHPADAWEKLSSTKPLW